MFGLSIKHSTSPKMVFCLLFFFQDYRDARRNVKAYKACVRKLQLEINTDQMYVFLVQSNGPHQANLVLIAYASSEGSGEPAHPRSLARTFAARSYKQ